MRRRVPDDPGCGCHYIQDKTTEGDKFESDDPIEWYDGQIPMCSRTTTRFTESPREKEGRTQYSKIECSKQLWESNFGLKSDSAFEDEIEDMADNSGRCRLFLR